MKLNTITGRLRKEVYSQVWLAAGFMEVFSLPLVVFCAAARHAVGQLGMCPVLLCPREGELHPHGLPSPGLWKRGAAVHCSGSLLSHLCGPWRWVSRLSRALSGCSDPSSISVAGKLGKLFFLHSILLGRHRGQVFRLILFLFFYHVYIFNSFTPRPVANDKISAVSRCA